MKLPNIQIFVCTHIHVQASVFGASCKEIIYPIIDEVVICSNLKIKGP